MNFTKRELEIMYLMIWDSHYIAKELNLSVHTIKCYIRNILKKIGAVNRKQALIYCLQMGYLNAFKFDTKLVDAGFWDIDGNYQEEMITNDDTIECFNNGEPSIEG